ncbi:hypothetical protein [Peribacillus frigoritolerans]|nr:hypothetical protein [Peribacillus castrilensis]
MSFKLLLVNLVQILVNSSVTREFAANTREFGALLVSLQQTLVNSERYS